MPNGNQRGLLNTLLQFLGPQAAMRQQAQLPLPGLNVPGAMAGQPAIRPQGLGQGILQQLGGGIQSPAFPFVPPVPQQAIQPMLGRQAQAAPTGAGVPPAGAPTAGIAPGAPPVTPTPTERAEKPPKEGLTDQQRQLLALALQVGLPLALAGFGGGRGLAMGAGLAKGFGAAATQRRKLEAMKDQPVFTIDPETGQLTQTGTVPKGAKVIKKPKEKEDDITKALEAILGPQVAPPKEAGKEVAEKIRKLTFDTVKQAEASGLPKGTEVTIGGRPAILE